MVAVVLLMMMVGKRRNNRLNWCARDKRITELGGVGVLI